MDIKLFLDPVETSSLLEDLPASSFQRSIFINHTKMYDLDGIDIVLLGLTDQRSAGYEGSQPLSEFRRQLYQLSKTTGKNRILDLGNLRNGPTVEDTRLRLMEVCEYLLEKNIMPIIIGGSHDLDIGQYRAYEAAEKMITLLNIDARFDLNDQHSIAAGHIAKIIKHDPNYLFNYIQLGYQSYFVDPEQIGVMEHLSFDAVRLGELKHKLQEYEPVIRDADMMTFDLSSIQSLYFPASTHPGVFGLNGEEACQLCWYAGLNDKMTSIGFYDYLPERDATDSRSAQLLATMIWYTIEGFYHRKGDKNFMSNDYMIYEVAFENRPETIRFYKSKKSEKWWMEIPDEHSDSVFLRNKMIPCSYSDYETALDGELPQRWLKAMSR